MGLELDADDVFVMAEHAESEASRFYARLSTLATSARSRQILMDLAKMEEDHGKVFAAIRSTFPSGRAPLDTDAAKYGHLVATLSVNIRESLAENFAKTDSAEQIIQEAIAFEKDSIVFYAAMKEMLPDPAQREQVDILIKEEVGHIFALTGCLAPAVPSLPVPPSQPHTGLHSQADLH